MARILPPSSLLSQSSCTACVLACLATTGLPGYFMGTMSRAQAGPPVSEAAELLPDTVVAFAEIADLPSVVSTVMDHPLRQQVMDLPAYSAVLRSDPFRKLQTGITAFESSMGAPWQEALRKLTAGGVTVALDASSDGGVALLMKAADEDSLIRFRGFLLALQLMSGGKESQRGEYRGFTAYALGDLKMALLGDWLMLVNKPELGKAIIDQYLDRDGSSLSSNARFQLSRESVSWESSPPAVFGYLDIASLRSAGVGKPIFNERVDNFFGELVLGGILANIRQAAYATIELDVHQQGLHLRVATPHDRGWEAPREYYFGDTKQHASAPPLLDLSERLFAISAHRDLSQLWLRSGDLLSERAVDQLAKADTQLTTFFAGRDFGEDILGSLESDIQVVGSSQDFTDRLPRPAIELPAFALQFRMKDAESTQPELRRIFQSFIGFLNITGAMNGQPQLDLGMQSVGEATLYTSTYIPELDAQKSERAPIQFNFSPTIAFVGERFILSSSTSLARELVGKPDDLSRQHSDTRDSVNTWAVVEAQTLRDILENNRSQLVANNMLEKANSKEAAEAEIDLLMTLMSYLRSGNLKLNVSDSHMQLEFDIAVANGQ